ncbi:MAG: helix-turn-helix domain-containing protein [bacterium]
MNLTLKVAHKVLIFLEENEEYASIISKKLDITFSHIIKVLKVLHDKGVVTYEKTGRVKIYKLTETGKEYASAAKKLEMLEI